MRWITLILIVALASCSKPAGDPKPPGKLIDIGGRRLHLYCTGQGEPTVILEAGAGGFSLEWALVQSEVARFARVVSYDRAGYAWSDPGPTPRTMQQIARELHDALARAEIKPPYVFVGHSYGGLVVRTFAELYPGDVVGMVLVDSSHEDAPITLTHRVTGEKKVFRMRDLSLGRWVPPVSVGPPATAPATAPSTHPATMPAKLEHPFDRIPRELQDGRRWATALPNYAVTREAEFDYWPEEAEHLASQRGPGRYPLGDRPLVVVTQGLHDFAHGVSDASRRQQRIDEHQQLQADLLTLSRNSKQIIATHSGHHVPLEEPQAVIDAIREVVEAARRGAKLKP
jgi:pimeloyl-ACP methyl ester carboxylesterase